MNNKSSKIIIIILTILVIGLTGYIVYDKVLNKNISPEANEKTDNNVIDNYVGTWYAGESGSYSRITIRKDSSSNYLADIRVNKEIDQNNLQLYCYEDNTICYTSVDENNSFFLVVGNNKVLVIPKNTNNMTSYWVFDAK